jgi:hypothetical protein
MIKGQAPARRHDQWDATRPEHAPAESAEEGLNAETKFCPASTRWGDLSLDIPFYRTKSAGQSGECEKPGCPEGYLARLMHQATLQERANSSHCGQIQRKCEKAESTNRAVSSKRK